MRVIRVVYSNDGHYHRMGETHGPEVAPVDGKQLLDAMALGQR